MKYLSEKWFQSPKRKKRIVKKMMDRSNRNRALLMLQLRTAFSHIRRESQYLSYKALARRTRADVRLRRKYNAIILIHRQCEFKAALVRIHNGQVCRVVTIRPEHVEWCKSRNTVSKVTHPDGREEVYDIYN